MEKLLCVYENEIEWIYIFVISVTFWTSFVISFSFDVWKFFCRPANLRVCHVS